MIKSLEEFKVYNLAMELGDVVWRTVALWDNFERDTVGKQFVRASDSIPANLSEGLGRYHYKEAKHFSYFSRGSLYETKTWVTKAHNRGLIDKVAFEKIIGDIEIIGKMLNGYISSIGSVHEPQEGYG